MDRENLGTLGYKLGTAFYLLWGSLHLYAAFLSFALANSLEFGLVQAKLQQNGWNLALISLIVIGIAGWMNWRNSRTGYFANLILVSATDIGFVVLVMVPGHSADIVGPIVWLAGAAATTLGYLWAKRTP